MQCCPATQQTKANITTLLATRADHGGHELHLARNDADTDYPVAFNGYIADGYLARRSGQASCS
jgi:hypothetical protein